MNEFLELETELRRLRPLRPSSGLLVRIEVALADAGKVSDHAITPHRFRVNWIGVAAGLAVAAAFLLLARVDFHPGVKPSVATVTTATATNAPPQNVVAPNYEAAGLTQVVYSKQDEGLVFPSGAAEPLRKMRWNKREILSWQDRRSGAQLRVSYPAEEVKLIPVSGQ
jgi:hypothetical protein